MTQVERRVEREAVVAASVDDVWAALTERALLEEWLAREVEAFELEEGGEVSLSFEDGEERRGVVERVEEPYRLSFRWRRPLGPETLVEFTLEEAVGGCRVLVVESALVQGPRLGADMPWAPRLAALHRAAALAVR